MEREDGFVHGSPHFAERAARAIRREEGVRLRQSATGAVDVPRKFHSHDLGREKMAIKPRNKPRQQARGIVKNARLEELERPFGDGRQVAGFDSRQLCDKIGRDELDDFHAASGIDVEVGNGWIGSVDEQAGLKIGVSPLLAASNASAQENTALPVSAKPGKKTECPPLDGGWIECVHKRVEETGVEL